MGNSESNAITPNASSEKLTTKDIPVDQFISMFNENIIPDKDEFKDLNKRDVNEHILNELFTTEYGALFPEHNKHKNTLPYDHNRVPLIEPIGGMDYINASWITSKKIVAQNPTQQSISHYLQMIQERNVDTIVMLNKLLTPLGFTLV